MAGTIKSAFYLSEKAMAIINSAASEKKRGEWLSNLVETHHEMTEPLVDISECGVQEQILYRLANVERQNAAILKLLSAAQ